MWLGVHLFYITGFKNQVTALLHWAVTFIGNDRSERTATEQQIFAREALRRLDRGAERWSVRPRAPYAARSWRSARSRRPGSPTAVPGAASTEHDTLNHPTPHSYCGGAAPVPPRAPHGPTAAG